MANDPATLPDNEALFSRLSLLATATLSVQLRRHGFGSTVLGGLTALRPDLRLLGRARTLRYLPAREDASAARGMGVQRATLETLGPNDVLVIDARGDTSVGTIGDISVQRAAKLGIAGIVTDGALRDSAVIAALDLPVYFSGLNPSQPSRNHVPWEADVAVACGGVLVEPGDLLVGDADGVLVIPPAVAEEVVVDTEDQEREERFVSARVAEGESLDGLFPMGPRWRALYEEWRAANPDAP